MHLFKDSQRIQVPVNADAVDAAVANVEWAVDRITDGDFPRRASTSKCGSCDFAQICAQKTQPFAMDDEPPALHLPDGEGGKRFLPIAAFSQVEPEQ